MVVLAICLLPAGGRALTWVETSRSDFADGTFEEGISASGYGDGAIEFAGRFDLNGDGFIDVVCPDDSGPYLRVYFGSATGFDSTRSRFFPCTGGGGVDFADLNSDGHADLVHSGWGERKLTIYWGTDSGPSGSDTTNLNTVGLCEAARAFDLDRDGWLDIVCGTDTGTVLVFWGGAGGYSNSETTAVYLGGRIGQNIEVADLDQDGWADVVPVDWVRNTALVLYWGPGRQMRDTVELPTADGKPHGCTVADLDRDGWLDLVFSCYDNGTRSFIYYGSEYGYSVFERDLIFPEQCFGGTTACYWDSDSTLDLVFLRGEYRGTPSWVPIVYFNRPGARPRFADERRANIGSTGFNSSGGLVADFNKDGSLDLFLNNYALNGRSAVLWGPNWTSLTRLPSRRAHHGFSREIGNVYDRSFHETYISSVFSAPDSVIWRSFDWDDLTPGGSTVEMWFRSGDESIPSPEWTEWLRVRKGDSIPSWMASRRTQYRAEFQYTDPAQLPALLEVRVAYDSTPWIDFGATEVIAPSGSVDSGTQAVPRAVIANLGHYPGKVRATMRIGPYYIETLVDSLPVGGVDTLTFPAWTAAPTGSVPIACFTKANGDRVRSDDTAYGTVVVQRVPDVTVTAVTTPGALSDSGTVYAPAAVVRNLGTRSIVFPVTMEIEPGYRSTVTDTLAMGAEDTVTFDLWTAQPRETLDVTCYTALSGDPVPANDTLRGFTYVGGPGHHDIGVVQILEPLDTLRAGDTVRPRATVRNFGNRAERLFDVSFRVGGAYSRSVTVNSTVEPDSSVDIEFPIWVAAAGSYTATCSTRLAFDVDRSNDSKSIAVEVTRFVVLDIGTDQSDTIAGDSVKAYLFHADLSSDSARMVDLDVVGVASGWKAELRDSAGIVPIENTLGLVRSGVRRWFSLVVTAPGADLSGVADTTLQTLVIRGWVRSDTAAKDSAALVLGLLPRLTIHNYPNPCYGQTRFIIGLPEAGTLTLALYTRAGERVRLLRDRVEAGPGVLLVDWDGNNDASRPVAPGAYRYVLEYEHGGAVSRTVKKLVLVRE